MKFVADFHIHSKYSRATSKDMDFESLDRWANIKGIRVLGAGDFTHPEWFRILKEKLGPAEPGFFTLKSRITNHKTGKNCLTRLSNFCPQQLQGILPADSVPKMLNLTVWSIFAWLLFLGGGQIAGVGTKLLKG
ncbi:MAG: ATP-dependent DNA helicase [Parcubacteria group bacterium GW2011_GWA2_47_9]|nr:MAG: ATP-dependent DNA helicase [Parcubacteria group bacterium GW2011_GWA2_47_9]